MKAAAPDMNVDIAEAVADQLDRLLARSVTKELHRSVERGGTAVELWRMLDEMGMPSALSAECAGGAGLSWSAAARALLLLGQHLPPCPLGETMLGAWLLGLSGTANDGHPQAVFTSRLRLGEDGRVNGEDALVSWAPAVRSFLAIAGDAQSQRLVEIDADVCEISTCLTLERMPAGAVVCSSVRPKRSFPVPALLGEWGLRVPLAVLRAQQMAGALTRILSLSVEYANSRTQFGRTIGKFQAIQHQLAELAESVAAALVAARYGLRQLDCGDAEAALRGAAVAKVVCGLSAKKGAAIAHQVFGAIGITEEHSLHDYTRRLWQWREDAGSEFFWSEILGHKALSQSATELWATIADG